MIGPPSGGRFLGCGASGTLAIALLAGAMTLAFPADAGGKQPSRQQLERFADRFFPRRLIADRTPGAAFVVIARGRMEVAK